MMDLLRSTGTSALSTAVSFVTEQVATTGLRLQKDTIFSTLEDFERCDPDARRLAIIGVTGAADDETEKQRGLGKEDQ